MLTKNNLQAVDEVNRPQDRFECGSWLRTVQAATWLVNVTDQGQGLDVEGLLNCSVGASDKFRQLLASFSE